MKRTLKKALSILLAVTMIFGTVAFGLSDVDWSEFAVEAEAVSEDIFTCEINDGEVIPQEEYTPCKSERCRELAEKSRAEAKSAGSSDSVVFSGSSSGYLAGEELFDAEVDKLLEGIDGNTALTDEQKALLIHDRLSLHCEYGSSGRYSDQSKEAAIVDRLAVCAGYSNAYAYLLNKVGIEAYYIRSTQLDHAWNIVKIDGEFYHVDVTWDDAGITAWHQYFLLSEEIMRKFKHDASDYQISDYYASKFGFDYPYDENTLPPTGNKYDAYFWRDPVDSFYDPMLIPVSTFQLIDNNIYYIDKINDCLKSYDGTVICDGFYYLDEWLITDGVSLFFIDYYDGVYKYDLSSSKAEVIFSSKDEYDIYGLEYENGKLLCYIRNYDTDETYTEIIYYADVISNTIFYESRHDFGKENVVVGETIKLPSPKHFFEFDFDSTYSGIDDSDCGVYGVYEGSVDCLGWTSKSDGKTVEFACGSSFTPSEDTVLYAIWPETVSFKIPDYVSEKLYNFNYYDDKVFLGWSKKGFNATTPDYYPGDTVTLSQNEYFISPTYLYPVWTDINNVQTQTISFKYSTPSKISVVDGYSLMLPDSTVFRKIYYDANGGTGAPDTKEVSLVCAGWSTSSDATTVEYPCGSIYKPEDDITFYAVWENSETTLSSTIPTREGYKFLGWAESRYATTAIYAPGDTIDVSDGGVYLYAVWDIEGYTINYHANGGEVNPAEEKVAIGATTTLPTPQKEVRISFEMEGDIVGSTLKVVPLVCNGWSTNSNAVTAEFACGSTYKPTADIDLYSVWQEATTEMISYTPSKRGYCFLGWSTDESATTVNYAHTDTITVTEDITLYAVWGNGYKAEFRANGGEFADGKTTKVVAAESGSKLSVPEVPVKPGYTFVGWDSEVPDVMPARNLVFNAVYVENNDPEDPPAVDPTEPTTKPVEPTNSQPTQPTEPSTKPEEPTTEPTTQPTTKPVVTVPVPSVEIRTPSQSTINYGDSIVLHADVENLPEGAYIEWSVSSGNFRIVSCSVDRGNCTITPEANGADVITVTVYDADGNEICSDSQTMTAKAGFFQKIIAFFKKLFGMTKIIPAIFKNIF